MYAFCLCSFFLLTALAEAAWPWRIGSEILELIFDNIIVGYISSCALGIMQPGSFSSGTSGGIDLNLQGALMNMMDSKLPWKTKFLRQIFFMDFWALSYTDKIIIRRYPKCWYGSHF